MGRKAKQYITDTNKVVKWLSRWEESRRIQPTIKELSEATGIPLRTLYNKREKLQEEKR